MQYKRNITTLLLVHIHSSGIMATSSRHALILVFVICVACFAEERSLYLVLLEGEPVAFHDPRKLELNRYHPTFFPLGRKFLQEVG